MKKMSDNWKLKLLSIFGAIVLWSFVISMENPSVVVDFHNIDIVYENENKLNEKGLVLVDKEKPKISIKLKGPRNKLMNINKQHIRVSADLSKYEEGIKPLNLNFDLPDNTQLAEEPAPININIERIITKTFHVNIKLEGKMEDEYILESAISTPETISVKGPRSLVETINRVEAKLDITDIKKDMVANANIEALNDKSEKVENIILGQSFVNINVSVKKQKEVSLDLITEGKLPEARRIKGITLSPQTFHIKGDSNLVDKIDKVLTTKVDLSKLYSTNNVEVQINLPTGVSLVNTDTKFFVRFDIEEEIEKEILFPTSRINFSNKSDGKRISFDKPTFKVRIKGYEGDLAKVTHESLSASYDLGHSGDGTMEITPKVDSKGNYKIENIEKVKLTIK